jgi:hypothetical protein
MGAFFWAKSISPRPANRAVYSVPQFLARLEMWHQFSRNLNKGSGFWVSSSPPRSQTEVECSKASNFDAVAVFQGLGHLLTAVAAAEPLQGVIASVRDGLRAGAIWAFGSRRRVGLNESIEDPCDSIADNSAAIALRCSCGNYPNVPVSLANFLVPISRLLASAPMRFEVSITTPVR